MAITVAISTVADGSMYNRNDYNDRSVYENRRNFLNKLGISPDQTTHLHPTYDRENYCEYYELSDTDKGRGIENTDMIIADGIIVTQKNHAIMLPVADCIGMVLYDPTKEVLMVSHLGRHSLEQNGAQRSVEHLVTTYGSNAIDIHIWMTPAAGKEEYPLWSLDNKGMKEVAFEQLQAAGIQSENITDNPTSTTTDANYFSYSEFLKGNRDQDGDHCIVAMMRD